MQVANPFTAIYVCVCVKDIRDNIHIYFEQYIYICSKEQQEEIRKPSSVINAKKEENNRMGATRDLVKKIRDTKGTFRSKMAQ